MSLEKISIRLENCYGIRSVTHEFDFSNSAVYAIYAPNGSMKTSFAQTFKDLSEDNPSKDRVFPGRVSTRTIVDSTGANVKKECVYVVSPYDEGLGVTEKTAVLLVDAKLRKEYERLHAELNRSKKKFLTSMRKQSKSRLDLEREISFAFTRQDGHFYRALRRVEDEVESQQDAPLANIKYNMLFNDRVKNFLETQDFKVAVEDYVRKYNELLDESKYFSRETFNYYNASTVARSLASNGFFDAKHSVNLYGEEKIEINSQDQLEALVAKEKERISSDHNLRRKFAEIEKLLTKNAQLRGFQDYLAENEILLPKLANIDVLKEEVWKSYFKVHFDIYQNLIDQYRAMQKRKVEIESEARKQRTQWESVIDIFNSRFFVPFKLVLQNRERVILGTDPIPQLGFVFDEGQGGDRTDVNKETLMRALSTGEKKAFYILNIIFEVEARRKAQQETLFVFDDIADSFDYRNKYAIVQYLIDIGEEPNFKQILLSHNFDFFRTVNSRFVRYDQCLMAIKTSGGVSIAQATGIKNPFVNDWKRAFFNDQKKRIASIPFLRNLIEYTRGNRDQDFAKLTSLLHWKADSEDITQGDLDEIYNRLFGGCRTCQDSRAVVVRGIEAIADRCISNPGPVDSVNFEDKIVLSIAIRIVAERFMVRKISDSQFTSSIVANQTQRLLKRFSQVYPAEVQALNVLKSVVLMTPENIHLNSFMYEPILDMSDEHLRRLYCQVKVL